MIWCGNQTCDAESAVKHAGTIVTRALLQIIHKLKFKDTIKGHISTHLPGEVLEVLIRGDAPPAAVGAAVRVQHGHDEGGDAGPEGVLYSPRAL